MYMAEAGKEKAYYAALDNAVSYGEMLIRNHGAREVTIWKRVGWVRPPKPTFELDDAS